MPFHAQLPLWDNKSSAEKIATLQAMVLDLYGYALAGARENLRTMLQMAISSNEKESNDIATMLRLLDAQPNIMAQNCEIGHFTASALILDKEGRVLLHYHKNLKRWLQFGGHADYETDFAKVALREATEETGLPDLRYFPEPNKPQAIDFDVHPIPESKNRPAHLHLDIRYLLLTEQPDALNIPPDESQTLLWASFEEWLRPDNPKELEFSLKRLIKKAEQIYRANI